MTFHDNSRIQLIHIEHCESLVVSSQFDLVLPDWARCPLQGAIYVGRLGKAALANMGLSGTLAFASVVLRSGPIRGTKVVVSQAVGAGKQESVEHYPASGILIALALSLH